MYTCYSFSVEEPRRRRKRSARPGTSTDYQYYDNYDSNSNFDMIADILKLDPEAQSIEDILAMDDMEEDEQVEDDTEDEKLLGKLNIKVYKRLAKSECFFLVTLV